ncbi:MAG: insulinase family protein [Crocinitomicaceae bacterium]|nr:insulinase family protein [Crocinitomicaceae bacterium]
MITFEKFTLKNGLRVLFHKDETTPMAVVNLLYNVGARDENPDKTGFAHLFEHLMFGGSKNIESFDNPLQLAGGECNAFTNNDITNYYDILPVQNLETAFWLESDRMLELAFTPKSLEVQRNVVIEEFKQRYLNQPYGDVWLLLRPMVYKTHPYQWATIGKEISHIENATMDDVKSFFYKYYAPDNAVLVVGGNTTLENVKVLSEKWFGDIPSRGSNPRNLKPEPQQQEERELKVERDVPADAIYMVFRMAERMHPDHYTGDLTSDILSRGKSSRLYEELITKKQLFTSISAYISGGWEDGLFVVSGNLNKGVSYEQAKDAIWQELIKISDHAIEKNELIKVKNKFKTAKVFSEQSLMNRVMNIAFFEMMGQAGEINNELKKYDAVSAESIQQFCKKTFIKTNLSTLFIKAKNE